jgi:hypothetical protein
VEVAGKEDGNFLESHSQVSNCATGRILPLFIIGGNTEEGQAEGKEGGRAA